jgi:hypothetical protein
VATAYGSGTKASAFTYVGAPTVTKVNPSTGNIAGGNTVTVTGTNFTTVTSVKFGTKSGTSVHVTGSTKLTVKDPAATAVGAVSVSVTAVGGSVTKATAFTYKASAPVVTTVSPSSGSAAGGTSVVIRGTGFSVTTFVKFGGKTATHFTVTSNTKITASSPSGTPGSTVNITVTGPGGTSATNSFTQFTYGPVVTSVSPTSGSHNGGTKVTVKGAGFKTATSVQFGTKTVTTGITVNATGTQLTVKSPAHASGQVNVTVTAGGYTSKTNANDLFTYF